ncbi:uncharacterized protein LOC132543319 [Ylistrum balloti]|uniref:uncharacterized protein LOC132543319 n=1 Tax=Ylistrum balloti TaxID=509963 RepID=UPI0029057FCF|nr:uncharacterized protein LOC132543319 [Ylistrum balloti]
MASSAWLRYIGVVILIGCCSCKVVLFTDRQNGMREKDRQIERPSKQRQSKVKMSASPIFPSDMTDLGLIGRGKNGQIFGTLLSENGDGVSAQRQSIENFIDSFSTLFRQGPSPQTVITNTEDNVLSDDEVTFGQGRINSLRRDSGNLGSTANSASLTRAFPGQSGLSVLSSELTDAPRTLGPSRDVGRRVNMMSTLSGLDETRPAGGVIGQIDSFDDVRFIGIDQSQGVDGPVMRGENVDTTAFNQGMREASVQSRPSVRTGGSTLTRQIPTRSEMNGQRDRSSNTQASSTGARNSLFSSGVGGSEQNIVSGGVSGNLLQPIQSSVLRTDDTNAGGISASSLRNSLISNLLGRIFSTPSRDSDASLTVIENTLDGIDASESQTGGTPLFTRMATNNRITGDGQIGTGGAQELLASIDGGVLNADVIGSTAVQDFSLQRESQPSFDQNIRGESDSGARGQRIDDGFFGIGPITDRFELSGNRQANVKGSTLRSMKGRRITSASKIRPSKKGTGTSISRDVVDRQPKGERADSRKAASTRTEFISRGPYMVFQTSKPSNTKSGGSNKFQTRTIPSAVSSSGTQNSIASRKHTGKQSSQTQPSVSSGGPRDSFTRVSTSGSNPNMFTAGNSLQGQRQGNVARSSSRVPNVQTGNDQSANRRAGTFSSTFGSGDRPDVPIKVYMVLPNSAGGSATGSAGVTVNPTAVGASGGTGFSQNSRFTSNRVSPFGTANVSMGSTSNLRGLGLPNRSTMRADGRSVATAFGTRGNVRNMGSFSRRLQVGRNGGFGTNFGARRITPMQGMLQSRGKTSSGAYLYRQNMTDIFRFVRKIKD